MRTESLRLVFRDAGTPAEARWRLYEAWALLELGETREATTRLVTLADDAPPDLAAAASLAAARAWRSVDPEVSVPRFERLAADPDPVLAAQGQLGLAWIDADAGRFDAAAARLPDAPPALADTLREPHWRRAGGAALLSAAVPGAGQLYAGAPREAVAALVVVGGLAAGTVALAERESWTGAAVVGTLGVSFWLGNVYGAADAAARHNRVVRESATAGIGALEAPSGPIAPAPR